jgi:hypothetical protein
MMELQRSLSRRQVLSTTAMTLGAATALRLRFAPAADVTDPPVADLVTGETKPLQFAPKLN